ncbi:hypothetical protein B9Z19DRAFT_1195288 [Tuber borchii]|uniref:Uncharacterized protein n=1 Tax=Tuber borchii TaxID=42251 RepID=A0A2T6ZJP6_TUBBO|nr:hypothetical protein B9Z19DRAFT_1195288 [Tuber borchii]
MSSFTQSSEAQGSAPTCRHIYLTDEKKLMLVRLCVENQADFQDRRKGQFWAMISDLLHQEAGIFLKDPAGTVKGLVASRRTQLKVQGRESGTVQEDTDFTQAVDRWIEVEEEREHAKELAQQPKTQSAREAQEAEVHRSNLLRSAHLKRYLSSESSDGGNDDKSGPKRSRQGSGDSEKEIEDLGNPEEQAVSTNTIQRISSMRKKTRERAVREDTHEMITAVKGMGDAVALVAEKLGRQGEGSSRFLNMEKRLNTIEENIRQEGDLRQKQAERVEQQQEKTNQLLEGILSKIKSD